MSMQEVAVFTSLQAATWYTIHVSFTCAFYVDIEVQCQFSISSGSSTRTDMKDQAR